MGAALVAHLRAEARRRWPAWLAVVVLIAVVGGLVLGAVAGARRTHTAYARMVAATDAWDMLINPNEGVRSELDPDEVGRLPQVAEIGRMDGVPAVLVEGGEPTLGSGALVLAAADPRVFVEFARPSVIEGELFDPADPTHVMVDPVVAAHHGIAAGDTIDIATGSIDELWEWEMAGGEGPPPLTPQEALVTGVGVAHDGIVEDEAFAYGHIYLSRAFGETHDLEPFFYGLAVRLAPGATAAEVRAAVQAMVPTEQVEFKTEGAVADTVARGVLPHTLSLLLFAAVVGAAGVVVAGLALARQLQPLRTETPALSSLGVDVGQLRRAGAARCVVLVAAGSALALAVAVALSPLFPVGVAERAEIDPGVDVDVAVLLPGVAILALVLLGWAAVSLRTIGRPIATTRPTDRTGLGARLATSISSPIASTGLRAALGSREASARTAVAGLSLAVAAVAATVTFGASVDHLISTPPAFGWAWDAYLTLPSEEWHTPPEEIIDRAGSSPDVTGWSELRLDQVALGDERVPAVGIRYGRGAVGPTIVAGRAPNGGDEVALGGRTMRLLDVGLGDTVRAAGDGRELVVVGQAVFAGLGTYPGADRTELGKGALLPIETLEAVGEGFQFESLAITAASVDALDAALDSMLHDQAAALGNEEIELHRAPARPSDVRSLSEVRSTPLTVASVLAILGGAAFAFVLVSGVRARRREIAVLKTFGFRGRDVAGTVALQATATAAFACVIGIPLGVVAGNAGWQVLADVLGVAAEVRAPLALLVVLVGVVVVANLLAVVPGIVAARTRPATMLRTE